MHCGHLRAGLRPHSSSLPAGGTSQRSTRKPHSAGFAYQSAHARTHCGAHKCHRHHSGYYSDHVNSAPDGGDHADQAADNSHQRRQMEPAHISGGRQVHPGQDRPARDGELAADEGLISACCRMVMHAHCSPTGRLNGASTASRPSSRFDPLCCAASLGWQRFDGRDILCMCCCRR
jgi:hypothetical protein